MSKKETALRLFNDFLKSQHRLSDILVEDFKEQYRYFRITTKGRKGKEITSIDDLRLLCEDENNVIFQNSIPVGFCSNFFAIPSEMTLKNNQIYKDGLIIGIDVASGVAVDSLQFNQGDLVLDICCAPGAKLLLISEKIGPTGFVLGIDICPSRLDVCRALLKKFSIKNAGLLQADATTLDFSCLSTFCQSNNEPKTVISEIPKTIIQPLPIDLSDSIFASIGSFWNQWKMPYDKLRKIELNAAQQCTQQLKFDKVLVDAECTHDGSIRHINKFNWQWGWNSFDHKVLSNQRLKDLNSLQLSLLKRGFLYLKEGGSLVYSTCSLCAMQNEEIVHQFLSTTESARVSLLPFRLNSESQHPPILPCMEIPATPIVIGGVVCACLFEPKKSGTSGLFFCLISKGQLNQ